MVRVTYVQPDGRSEAFELEAGLSVMQGATRNGVAGIDADCGGACSCATCHVKIDPNWAGLVGPPNDIEAEMLDSASDVDETSRLSCQIKLTQELDGLIVFVPAQQH
jgi:2Fe-2S ferredoxin